MFSTKGKSAWNTEYISNWGKQNEYIWDNQHGYMTVWGKQHVYKSIWDK